MVKIKITSRVEIETRVNFNLCRCYVAARGFYGSVIREIPIGTLLGANLHLKRFVVVVDCRHGVEARVAAGSSRLRLSLPIFNISFIRRWFFGLIRIGGLMLTDYCLVLL